MLVFTFILASKVKDPMKPSDTTTTAATDTQRFAQHHKSTIHDSLG